MPGQCPKLGEDWDNLWPYGHPACSSGICLEGHSPLPHGYHDKYHISFNPMTADSQISRDGLLTNHPYNMGTRGNVLQTRIMLKSDTQNLAKRAQIRLEA